MLAEGKRRKKLHKTIVPASKSCYFGMHETVLDFKGSFSKGCRFMEEKLPVRKIVHIDMDAFYASVEQMDTPALRGKPIAVGGDRERGVVAAASYEARKYGVKSAMPSVVAARRCPDLIFVPPRFERYKEISEQIRAIFYEYTDLVEPLSLDEAFLDVTENKINHPSATLLAEEIRYRIYTEVGLTASAGISINKFTAKIASDINKPNGQRTIPPEEVLQFLKHLPIEKFFGVGKVTAEKMKLHGIFIGSDLKAKSRNYLQQHFGKSGAHFYNIVRGIQRSAVQPDRIRKSIAAERTFQNDLDSEKYILEHLNKIAGILEERVKKSEVKGKTITLKLKYNDFTQQTRSKTVPDFLEHQEAIYAVVRELVQQRPIEKPVRLLGISMTKLNVNDTVKSVSVQLGLDF
jgi:DNA polymerase-4